MRYTTLAELAAAYKSGELKKKSTVLILDNDCSNAYVEEKGVTVCVFAGGGPDGLIREALKLLGIPFENA